MRKVWKLDVGWDSQLPKEICDEMKSLIRDLEIFSELSFPRQALNEQNSCGLHIFYVSSVESYGFVAYALDQDNKGSILFSKSKLAPLNKRNKHSVPTLELTLLRRTHISQIVSHVPKPSAERRPSVKKDFSQKSQLV